MKNVFKKGFSIFRDNSIVYLLNKIGWFQTGNAYNWLTTETIDSVVFLMCSKIGIHSIEAKYLIILIFTFII